jgi:hypothetical protein
LFPFSDTPFPPNNPLGMLSNLTALNMGVPNLQSFQHSDVLEKIKMQVRDMKVGFMNSDFSVALHPSFTSTLQNTLGFNTAAQINNQNSTQGNNNESPNGFPFSSPSAVNKDGKTDIFYLLNYASD